MKGLTDGSYLAYCGYHHVAPLGEDAELTHVMPGMSTAE